MKKRYLNRAGNALFIACLFFSESLMANTYTVTNTNSSGAGSLADAITSANSNPGPDVIDFNLPEGFSMTIALTTALPAITEEVTINGYSQSGTATGSISTRTIRVNIDGTALPGGSNVFTISAPNVTIAGLAIYGAPDSGIRLLSGGDQAWIWGNYIGTDSTGLNNVVGNLGNGIVSNELNGTSLTGVIIGTNGDGTTDAEEGNLISGNGVDGIFLWRTTNSYVAGNIIGLDKNASLPGFGNRRNGMLITVFASGNTIGTNGDGVSDDVEGNFISNNAQRGILIASVSDNNVVAGNIIGLDVAGGAAGNGQSGGGYSGIEISPGSSNRIGTNGDGVSDALEANIICSSGLHGIALAGLDFFGSASNSNDNIIAGNFIGTDATATLSRGNTGDGIYLYNNNGYSTDNNRIGSNNDLQSDDLEGNTIVNNAKGIVIAAPVSATITGNKISRNSVHDNTQTGIDLADDGITANDDGDPDTGPNELFNFPIITGSKISGTNLVVSGITPANSVVEFYIADAGGEGQTFLFRAQEGATLNGIADDSTGTDTYTDATYGTGTDNKFGFTIPVASLPAAVNTGTVINSLAIKGASADSSSSEFGPSFITILPVRWLSFTGAAQQGVVHLNWTTAAEINASHFVIERSGDGNQFTELGTVAAKGSSTYNEYEFTDAHPIGVNYYRLRQVDLDGKSNLSSVLLIHYAGQAVGFRASPNPFAGTMNISFSLTQNERVQIRLYNSSGQLVKQARAQGYAGNNSTQLQGLSYLPSGTYTVEVRSSTGRVQQQVVKQ